MNIKNYLLSKLIDTLSVEDSFFYKVKFEKKVKLSDEIIAFNYKKYAPFKNPLIVNRMEKNDLYLWFYEKNIKAKIIIPEAYLLFDALKEKYPNNLLFIETLSSFIVLVIKNGILENSYSALDEEKTFIAMELNKYNLSSFQKIDKNAYLKIKEQSLKSISFKDVYKWSSFKVEPNKLIPTVVNFIAYPFAFLLFFIMAVESYHLNEVKKKLDLVEHQYSLIKSKNDDVREKINLQTKKEEKWIAFAQRELPYVSSIETFLSISKAFSKKDFTFTSFSIMGSKVKITVKTKEDFIEGITLLNNIKGLKNVALKSSSKKRETASYEATLEKGIFW